MKHSRFARALTLLLALLGACSAGTGGGGGNTVDVDGGGGGGGGSGNGGGGGGTCATANFRASPGLEACFACMQQRCCDVLRACDGDETCRYCQSAEGRLDTSRCVDPDTFMVYAPTAALARCQAEQCVSPCGVNGGTSCTPSNCAPSCAGYSRGCR